jgi:hypothetical protein
MLLSLFQYCCSVSLFRCVTLFSLVAFPGGSLPHSRQTMPITPQQRYIPSLLPRLRQYGGCSCVYRHFLWRKIRNPVAVPVFTAMQSGDNMATFAIDRHNLPFHNLS